MRRGFSKYCGYTDTINNGQEHAKIKRDKRSLKVLTKVFGDKKKCKSDLYFFYSAALSKANMQG